jgi:hypothetical protein
METIIKEDYEERTRAVATTDIVLWVRGGKASKKLKALLVNTHTCIPHATEPVRGPDAVTPISK